MVKCYIKDYPRPQFVRESWMNLCGEWDFSYGDGKDSDSYCNGFSGRKIKVPFTYETAESGINETEHHSCVWYSRKVTIDEKQLSGRVILNFEGSDYVTTAYVNGKACGQHRGGYARFSFDITEFAVAGENTITVRCEDSKSKSQPRGKQRWIDDNFGCWYVQTTGIWKPVWLEFTAAQSYLKSVKITPCYDTKSVEFNYDVAGDVNSIYIEAEISFGGEFVSSVRYKVKESRNVVNVDIANDRYDWSVPLWSPEKPNLYDIVFNVYSGDTLIDTVGSYFGMRKVSISGDNVLLNNHPIYQKLCLNQGYWAESGLTAPSEEALVEDIDKLMELGYNGVRIHQKTEDERFLFWCDVKGMLTWSEMAATYAFDDAAVQNLTTEWIEIFRQNYNHPSVITWVPFNESWGVDRIMTCKMQQAFTVGIYNLTKAMDNMRPVVTNDGWEHTCSDIITIHDYEQDAENFHAMFSRKDDLLGNKITMTNGRFVFAQGYEYKGQPVIISEYGGIAIRDKGEGWGYGTRVDDVAGLEKRYDELTSAIMDLDYVCGFCYTQVTDVEQEVNGIMYPDRQIKCSAEAIKKVHDKIK